VQLLLDLASRTAPARRLTALLRVKSRIDREIIIIIIIIIIVIIIIIIIIDVLCEVAY
jgi:hypothetical protein